MFVCIQVHVCSRRVLIISLHVHRLWISLLIEFSSKTDKRNITKKIIRYLCFIPVDSIHSCHQRLKKSNFILEKNRFWSIDLTCWRSTNHILRSRFLTALNTSSWKVFWSKGDNSHFENFSSFQISWIWSDVFQINKKFIHNCLPCLLAKMAKVASSVARPQKCYINHLEWFI